VRDINEVEAVEAAGVRKGRSPEQAEVSEREVSERVDIVGRAEVDVLI
jgi:hypothetical protein